MDGEKDARLLLRVYQTQGGVITVITERWDGGGTRLCGVKLMGSGSRLIAEFFLDRDAVQALVEDFEKQEADHE